MIPINPFKYNNMKEFQKDQDLALRNIFKNEIKPNFLIKIYHKVVEKFGPDLLNYYPQTMTMENSISGNTNYFEYDICKMIIGIHKSNMIFRGESEKRKSLEDSAYESQLIDEVIKHIKLRQYGSSYFRQKQIVAGDRFLYFQLPYDLFVMCIRMNYILYEKRNSNIPCYSFFSKIANMGLSALSLLEDNFLDNIYPICRGIIELYITFLAISTNKNALKKYNDFTNYEMQQSQCGQQLPNEFYDIFEKRLKKESENEKPHEFLHYGWVDDLKDYHKIVKRKPYTIKGLTEYLKVIKNDDTYKMYYDFYQKCNPYTHANIRSSRYPLLSYFEVSIMLYITIRCTYLILCGSLKKDKSINEIEIVNKTDKDYELILNQYNKRSTENFDKYYSV